MLSLGGGVKFYFMCNGVFIEKHILTPLEIQHMSKGQYSCQVGPIVLGPFLPLSFLAWLRNTEGYTQIESARGICVLLGRMVLNCAGENIDLLL